MTRRRYHAFSPDQVAYLRAHYQQQGPAPLAARWNVSVRQVYELAKRHGVKRRAPNGAPVWRTSRQSSPCPAST